MPLEGEGTEAAFAPRYFGCGVGALGNSRFGGSGAVGHRWRLKVGCNLLDDARVNSPDS